jgi:hypothetical protein
MKVILLSSENLTVFIFFYTARCRNEYSSGSFKNLEAHQHEIFLMIYQLHSPFAITLANIRIFIEQVLNVLKRFIR